MTLRGRAGNPIEFKWLRTLRFILRRYESGIFVSALVFNVHIESSSFRLYLHACCSETSDTGFLDFGSYAPAIPSTRPGRCFTRPGFFVADSASWHCSISTVTGDS